MSVDHDHFMNSSINLTLKSMKKIIFALFILAIGIAIIWSCKKLSLDDDNSQSSINEQEDQISPTERRILSFIDQMNSDLKTSGDYDVDSALWYVESTVNYTYGNGKIPYDSYSYDSIFITVEKTNSKISSTDVSDFYDNLVDSLEVRYDDISATNKHMVFADVAIKEEDTREIEFIIRYGFTHGTTFTPTSSFGTDDHWYHDGGPDGQGGYCGGQYNGTMTNWDAAMKIAQHVRYVTALPSGRFYYTDIVNTLIMPWGLTVLLELGVDDYCDYEDPDDPVPNDNMMDYFLFFCSNQYITVNVHDCLIPNEMNHYLDGTIEVIDEIIYECLDELGSRDRISLLITGVDISNPPVFYGYYHRTEAQYGTYNYISSAHNNF